MKTRAIAQQAVWQNGGFSAFLEAKVLNRSSGIFSNFGAENPPLRQAAGTLVASFARRNRNQYLTPKISTILGF